jgi:hypothetical protein
MTLTLRDIPTELNDALQKKAQELHRAVDEVAVEAMSAGLGLGKVSMGPEGSGSLASAIRARFAPLGGLELPEVAREPMREATDFGQ